MKLSKSLLGCLNLIAQLKPGYFKQSFSLSYRKNITYMLVNLSNFADSIFKFYKS